MITAEQARRRMQRIHQRTTLDMEQGRIDNAIEQACQRNETFVEIMVDPTCRVDLINILQAAGYVLDYIPANGPIKICW